MDFLAHRLNTQLSPSVLEELNQAIAGHEPCLVLLYATPTREQLVARDYLRQLIQDRPFPVTRPVVPVQGLSSHAAVELAVALCQPGSLVFLDELRPSQDYFAESVKTGARFVQRGATVFGTVHAMDEKAARNRLIELWAKDANDPAQDASALDALPIRFIAFH